MTNYTNYLETITNGTNIYRVYEVMSNVVTTQTNFITETNTVTSLSDPALLVTIVASALTALSAFLMWRSVLEMKKQNKQSHNNSIIMALIQYDQQIISIINDITDYSLENTNNNPTDSNKLRYRCTIVQLQTIIIRVIMIYYSKLCENNDYLKSFFNEFINPPIKIMIYNFEKHNNIPRSKHEVINNTIEDATKNTTKHSHRTELQLADKLLIKYCEEQNIDIPDELL